MDAKEFFGGLVEPLCDAFRPEYCDLYADMMAELLGGGGLRERYERVRRPRPWEGPDPETVLVLSRVTLGADVVVTSVILDGMKRRFPEARLQLVGSRKAWELFAADARIGWLEAPYSRGGSVHERLAASHALTALLPQGNVLIVDPDSRLTQLGLVPVCAEEQYRFFESRSYQAETTKTLAELARDWVKEVFDVDAAGYVAPEAAAESGMVTVSLGVGENLAKSAGAEFERGLIEGLAARGFRILVDYGAGDEEAQRVRRAIAGVKAVATWQGAFAPFAARIMNSGLYVGYDSAGQHVAAVSGVPLVTVFGGYATPRTFERWKPHGPGPKAILQPSEHVLAETLAAADRLLRAS
jgi:ADP-heptose:LPS heptosyltransferase